MKTGLEAATVANSAYRRVIETTPQMQLVLMSLPPGAEIGLETHRGTTQFFRVEEGTGSAQIGTARYRLRPGDALVVPPGVEHNVKASRTSSLKLYTIYSPPHHAPGAVQQRQ